MPAPVIHSSHAASIEAQIDAIKAQAVGRKPVEPFMDPIREFHRASRIEGTVRNWLTFSVEAREKMAADQFNFFPKQDGERDEDFKVRELERWRALCVIIQEESRAAEDNQSLGAAKTAFKKLFPKHNWANKPKA